MKWLAAGVLAWCAWTSCLAVTLMPRLPRVRLLTEADGLPSQAIMDVLRDRSGLVWMATEDGLARYDGAEVRVWRREDGLASNRAQRLALDGRGRLWIATDTPGLSVFEPGALRPRLIPGAAIPGWGAANVFALEASGDDLWVGTGGEGLYRFREGQPLQRIRAGAGTDGLPADTVSALAAMPDGSLMVGTTRGLARMRGGRFERIALPGEAADAIVYALHATGAGVWVGAASGVYYLNAQRHWHTPVWSTVFRRPNAALRIGIDSAGDVWIGSQRGAWHVGQGAWPRTLETPRPLAHFVRGVCVDADGGVWVGMPGHGLGYLRPDWRSLAELRYGASSQDLPRTVYRAITATRDGSGLWLGGDDGDLNHVIWDGTVTAAPAQWRKALGGVFPFALLQAADGSLWVGERKGLKRLRANGAVDDWPADDSAQAPPAEVVSRLRQAPDGSVWLLAGTNGLQQRSPDGQVLRTLRDPGEMGLALELDPSGVPHVIDGSGRVARPGRSGSALEAVPGIEVRDVDALAFGQSGDLWVHHREGLDHYQPGASGMAHVATDAVPESILAAGDSSAMRVDATGQVWMATRRGLLRWSPTRRVLKRIGLANGLLSQDVFNNGDSLLLDTNDRLATTTQAGSLVIVDTTAPEPASRRPVFAPPTVEARRDGKWVALQGVMPELAPQDHELRVLTRLMSYDDPGGNLYWSRLGGMDGSWVAQGSSSERILTGLSPGLHRLHIRARDALGNAAVEREVRFRVLAPWWATRWAFAAYVMCALLLAMLAWRLWQRRRLARAELAQIEQRRQLAEEASLAKTRFLATLGHEIRTPMTGVMGMSELLEGTTLDERQRGQVRAIRRAGDHLLRLVDDALDLARIEAGKLELADAPFRLRELIGEVAEWARPNAERKGLVFALEVDETIADAFSGDVVRVRQVLMNLLGNAIKFTEHGSVSLRVLPLHPMGWATEIRDSGPGMDAAQQARLFRRFEQAGQPGAHPGGSGLGLAISQELCSAMGGHISVKSAPQQGACFRAEFPLAAVHAPHVFDPPVTPLASLPSDHRLRLLLVEDDLVIAEVLTSLLQEQGHAVVHAPHALAAMAEAGGTPFDAALLDLDLPGMDGLALARLLREQGFVAPLLAVTARADASAEADALSTGFDAFLRKPVSGLALKQALAGVLADRQP